jgi:hypothetical protein
VGLRAGLDTEARGKTFASAGDRNPVVQSVDRYYINGATPGSITGAHTWQNHSVTVGEKCGSSKHTHSRL